LRKEEGLISLCQYDEQVLLTSSLQGKIKLYDARKGFEKPVMTNSDHEDFVAEFCVNKKTNRVVSVG
jgi:hypothetical protein